MNVDQIARGIYMVGGADITVPEDAAIFVVEAEDELFMIDCGAGGSTAEIEANIREIGLEPPRISMLILTHCHVDHIGAAHYFRETYHCRIAAHELDAAAIETGDPRRTASTWYGVDLPRTTVDDRLVGDDTELSIGGQSVHCLHTPGHTPGSIVVWLERDGQRILFGQDIHGPFHRDFGSDIALWRHSMAKILALEADILCEGHCGIFSPRERVKRYIQGCLDRTERGLL